MSRWSARRGQAEPLAALAATAVVAAAIAAAVGVVPQVLPPETDRNRAVPVATEVTGALRVGGVVRPSRLDPGRVAPPPGRRYNVTVTARNRTWSIGAEPPPASSRAVDGSTRVVPVRVGSAVVPGRVRVEVWS